VKDRNQLLLDFASDWTLDGDLLRCRSCNRAQIASRQDEDFVHRSDCEKNRTGGRPWTVLQSILLTMPSGQSVMDLLAAANAQRNELLRDISVALQMLREASDRSAKPDEKRGLCTSAFCNGNHHDSSCEGDYMTSRWLESMSEAIARAQSGQPPCNGPVGINGQRDPDHPCDMFRNGEPSERNTCDGDGHYLCNECGHYRCDPPEQSGQPGSAERRDDDLSKHDDHCNCERCR